MKTEPKPATQTEWTEEWLKNRGISGPWERRQLCEWHNAALAAEREKVQPLMERLEQLRCYTNVDGRMLIDDALAQLKERP